MASDFVRVHGKAKYFCEKFGGAGICKHGKRKSRCKDCRGAARGGRGGGGGQGGGGAATDRTTPYLGELERKAACDMPIVTFTAYFFKILPARLQVTFGATGSVAQRR